MYRICVILFVLIQLAMVSVAAADTEESANLKIVYVNNLPDIEKHKGFGGLPELGGLLAETRKNHKNVLFFHGGGYLAPSALSSFDRGAHMIDILNSMHPDAVAAARKEFAHKEDELTLRAFEASFPILSSNTYDPATDGSIEGIERYQIFDVDSYKIGVFALTDVDVVVNYLVNRISVKDTQKVITDISDRLRKKGVDLVVLMLDFKAPNIKELLDKGVVDIVLDYELDDVLHPMQKGIWVELGSGKGRAALVDIDLKNSEKKFSWSHQEKIVSLHDYPQDPQTLKLVDSYRSHLSKMMDLVVGQTATAMDTRRSAVRLEENAFGNLVADAIRDFCSSDIAFMNGGGIRGERTYAPGSDLTRRDIHNELPFRNHVVCLRVRGKDILDALENGVSRIEDNKGRFLHVSGLQMVYDPQTPSGKRVRSVSIDNTPLDSNKQYVVGTVDYLASGGDEFSMLRNGERIGNIGGSPLLWELLRSYIADRGSVSPVVEGRIVRIEK